MATFVLCAEMETGGGGVGPVVIMARRPFEKKNEKFKKKIPSNRHGITLSNVVEDCQLIRGFGRIALLGTQLATAPVYVLFEM